MRANRALTYLIPLLGLATLLTSCVGEPDRDPSGPGVVPAPAKVITQVTLTPDGGAPTSSPTLKVDDSNGWVYVEPGNLYVGSAPESSLNEGAVTCVAPSNNPGYANGGKCAFYKQVTAGYGFLDHEYARVLVADLETDPAADGTGSGWDNGTFAILGNGGALARWSAPATTTPSGSPLGETNEVAACGGTLSWGANNDHDGRTCSRPVRDVHLGQDHILTIDKGIALQEGLRPIVSGNMTQAAAECPALAAVVSQLLDVLSTSQQIKLISRLTN